MSKHIKTSFSLVILSFHILFIANLVILGILPTEGWALTTSKVDVIKRLNKKYGGGRAGLVGPIDDENKEQPTQPRNTNSNLRRADLWSSSRNIKKTKKKHLKYQIKHYQRAWKQYFKLANAITKNVVRARKTRINKGYINRVFSRIKTTQELYVRLELLHKKFPKYKGKDFQSVLISLAAVYAAKDEFGGLILRQGLENSSAFKRWKEIFFKGPKASQKVGNIQINLQSLFHRSDNHFKVLSNLLNPPIDLSYTNKEMFRNKVIQAVIDTSLKMELHSSKLGSKLEEIREAAINSGALWENDSDEEILSWALATQNLLLPFYHLAREYQQVIVAKVSKYELIGQLNKKKEAGLIKSKYLNRCIGMAYRLHNGGAMAIKNNNPIKSIKRFCYQLLNNNGEKAKFHNQMMMQIWETEFARFLHNQLNRYRIFGRKTENHLWEKVVEPKLEKYWIPKCKKYVTRIFYYDRKKRDQNVEQYCQNKIKSYVQHKPRKDRTRRYKFTFTLSKELLKSDLIQFMQKQDRFLKKMGVRFWGIKGLDFSRLVEDMKLDAGRVRKKKRPLFSFLVDCAFCEARDYLDSKLPRNAKGSLYAKRFKYYPKILHNLEKNQWSKKPELVKWYKAASFIILIGQADACDLKKGHRRSCNKTERKRAENIGRRWSRIFGYKARSLQTLQRRHKRTIKGILPSFWLDYRRILYRKLFVKIHKVIKAEIDGRTFSEKLKEELSWYYWTGRKKGLPYGSNFIIHMQNLDWIIKNARYYNLPERVFYIKARNFLKRYKSIKDREIETKWEAFRDGAITLATLPISYALIPVKAALIARTLHMAHNAQKLAMVMRAGTLVGTAAGLSISAAKLTARTVYYLRGKHPGKGDYIEDVLLPSLTETLHTTAIAGYMGMIIPAGAGSSVQLVKSATLASAYTMSGYEIVDTAQRLHQNHKQLKAAREKGDSKMIEHFELERTLLILDGADALVPGGLTFYRPKFNISPQVATSRKGPNNQKRKVNAGDNNRKATPPNSHVRSGSPASPATIPPTRKVPRNRVASRKSPPNIPPTRKTKRPNRNNRVEKNLWANWLKRNIGVAGAIGEFPKIEIPFDVPNARSKQRDLDYYTTLYQEVRAHRLKALKEGNFEKAKQHDRIIIGIEQRIDGITGIQNTLQQIIKAQADFYYYRVIDGIDIVKAGVPEAGFRLQLKASKERFDVLGIPTKEIEIDGSPALLFIGCKGVSRLSNMARGLMKSTKTKGVRLVYIPKDHTGKAAAYYYPNHRLISISQNALLTLKPDSYVIHEALHAVIHMQRLLQNYGVGLGHSHCPKDELLSVSSYVDKTIYQHNLSFDEPLTFHLEMRYSSGLLKKAIKNADSSQISIISKYLLDRAQWGKKVSLATNDILVKFSRYIDRPEKFNGLFRVLDGKGSYLNTAFILQNGYRAITFSTSKSDARPTATLAYKDGRKVAVPLNDSNWKAFLAVIYNLRIGKDVPDQLKTNLTKGLQKQIDHLAESHKNISDHFKSVVNLFQHHNSLNQDSLLYACQQASRPPKKVSQALHELSKKQGDRKGIVSNNPTVQNPVSAPTASTESTTIQPTRKERKRARKLRKRKKELSEEEVKTREGKARRHENEVEAKRRREQTERERNGQLPPYYSSKREKMLKTKKEVERQMQQGTFELIFAKWKHSQRGEYQAGERTGERIRLKVGLHFKEDMLRFLRIHMGEFTESDFVQVFLPQNGSNITAIRYLNFGRNIQVQVYEFVNGVNEYRIPPEFMARKEDGSIYPNTKSVWPDSWGEGEALRERIIEASKSIMQDTYGNPAKYNVKRSGNIEIRGNYQGVDILIVAKANGKIVTIYPEAPRGR